MTDLEHVQAAPSRATTAWKILLLGLLVVTFIAAVGRPGSVSVSTAPKTVSSSAPVAHFSTLPPRSTLPTGAWCSRHVRRSSWEPRPENFTPNHTPGYHVYYVDGANDTAQLKFARRVNGNFTGTTDEIIQWGACKWGLDEDIVRAVAVTESWWRQSTVGDDGESFGLLQIKCHVHEGTCPGAGESTAFNVDYALAWQRSCFEGYFDWWVAAPTRGKKWGCIGLWFSGTWQTNSEEYIRTVKRHLRQKTWLDPDF
jgi:hypothetical protein